MPAERKLTATSYAILGWLNVRPWTTYELARQMQRGLSFFWPRAESRLYEEPKSLVAEGLATMERDYVGKRPRSVYKITDAGREALAQWHAQPSSQPSLDFEALIHLFLCETATPAQLLLALESARAHAEAIFEQGGGVAKDYFVGTYPFPERIHMSAFVFDFLWPFAELLHDWADRSQAEIETWRNTAPTARKRQRGQTVIKDCVERLAKVRAGSARPRRRTGTGK